MEKRLIFVAERLNLWIFVVLYPGNVLCLMKFAGGLLFFGNGHDFQQDTERSSYTLSDTSPVSC